MTKTGGKNVCFTQMYRTLMTHNIHVIIYQLYMYILVKMQDIGHFVRKSTELTGRLLYACIDAILIGY